MNICFWILILLYVFGIGFFIGEYSVDNVPRWERLGSKTPFEKILVFLFGPILAGIWLYILVEQEFFGRSIK